MSDIVDLSTPAEPVGLITELPMRLALQDSSIEPVMVEHEELMIERGTTSSGRRVVQILRAQPGRERPPHLVNYRAILRTFRAAHVRRVISISTAASLRSDLTPGTVAVPDQMVMWSRTIHTSFTADEFGFADMTEPFCPQLRLALSSNTRQMRAKSVDLGTYFSVNGPRFETAAEVKMFAQLGGAMVGMTTGPEAIYARELGICYANAALITNFGAGLAKAVEAEHVMYSVKAHGVDVAKVVMGAIETTIAGPPCTCQRPLTTFGPGAAIRV